MLTKLIRPQALFPLVNLEIENVIPFQAARAFSKCSETGIVTITDEADFKRRVLDNENPVIVDFFATWCNPCKMLTPRLEKAMDQYKEKVLLAKVDVDAVENCAANYSITSVPTVIAIKSGKEMERFSGLKDSEGITTFIAANS